MHEGHSSNMKHARLRYNANKRPTVAEHTCIPTLPLALITVELPLAPQYLKSVGNPNITVGINR